MPFLFAKWIEKSRLKSAIRHRGLVRLHVVAAGDSAEEQRIKLSVRDAVINAFEKAQPNAKTGEEAFNLLRESLDEIQIAAQVRARQEGYFGPVCAMAGIYPFPARKYEGVTVPAGEYRALRVILGTGEGRNWWCILFPALCLSCASNEPANVDTATFHWHLPAIFRQWF